MLEHAHMHQLHPQAQSEREAACEHHGIDETDPGADIVVVYKIVERVKKRYSRHQIEHACADGYGGGSTVREKEIGGTDH